MKKIAFSIAAFACFFLAIAVAGAGEPKTITIIERPGYFETHGDVFDISPGKYEIVVENRSGKDAGFVFNRGRNNVTTDNTSLEVILLKDGERGSINVDLSPGNYTYFCPIIPTPPYPLRVK
jgi:hypothetical protein